MQCESQLHSEFESNLDYMRLSQQRTERREEEKRTRRRAWWPNFLQLSIYPVPEPTLISAETFEVTFTKTSLLVAFHSVHSPASQAVQESPGCIHTAYY